MPPIALRAARVLDTCRAAILRRTLRVPLLRRVYLDRPLRLLALFGLVEAAGLLACVAVPVWQLVLGPLVYGVAHLASSLRYVHHGLLPDLVRHQPDRRTVWVGVGGLVGAYTAWKLARLFRLPVLADSEWQGAGMAEALFLVSATVLVALLYRVPARTWLPAVLIVGPVTVGLWSAPWSTIGLLAVAHNFVGFLYWQQQARTRRERSVALLCFAVLVGLTAGVTFGGFDGLRAPFDLPSGHYGVSIDALGRMLWRDATPELQRNLVSAFALGQTTHYFVWLKALPDQTHRHPVPTTYRQSVRLLGQDFGRPLTLAILVAVPLATMLWLALGLETGRKVYFAVAGFHGFLELAALGLMSPRPHASGTLVRS